MKVYRLSRFYGIVLTIATACLLLTCLSYATSTGLTFGTFMFGFVVFYGFAAIYILSTGMPVILLENGTLSVLKWDLVRTEKSHVNFTKLKSCRYTFPPFKLGFRFSNHIFEIVDIGGNYVYIPAFGWTSEVYEELRNEVERQRLSIDSETATRLNLPTGK